MDNDTTPAARAPKLPGLALALGLVWLLTGAMYKLFEGNVADLPSTVLDNSPFESPWDTFRYAIAAEFVVVSLVIGLPKIGWLFLGGTFATFLAVLFPLWQAGVESCGCFGGTVKIRPEHMMLVDGALLGLILSSKPWRMPKGAGLGGPAALVLMAGGVAGVLLRLPALETPAAPAPKPVAPVVATGPEAGADEPGPTDRLDQFQSDLEGATDDVANGNDAETGGDAEAEPEGAEVAEGPEVVEPPAAAPGLPPFMNLPFESWAGEDVYTLPFIGIADMSQGAFVPNAHVVVYRQTCEVCKEHLETLTQELQADPMKLGGKELILLRIIDRDDTPANNMCQVLPEPSQKVFLPALEKGYLGTTPIAFDVDETMLVQNIDNVRERLGH
ncbi:MAG: hypothetical protein AAFZ87_04505 [Planctomycetota bacterium]